MMVQKVERFFNFKWNAVHGELVCDNDFILGTDRFALNIGVDQVFRVEIEVAV